MRRKLTMPISKRKDGWYWGSQGPFDSRTKAEEVAQGAYASGYWKLLKEGDGAGGEGGTINGNNGTVFTSAHVGIFTPTHGGDSKKKKARKQKKEYKDALDDIANKSAPSGVEKLDSFVRNMSKALPNKTGQFQGSDAATQGPGDTNVDQIDWKKWDIDKDAPTPNSNMNSLNGSLDRSTITPEPSDDGPGTSIKPVPKKVAWENNSTVQKASSGNMATLAPQPNQNTDAGEISSKPQQAYIEKKPTRALNTDVKMNDMTNKTKENEKGININAIQNQWGSGLGNERGVYRRGADKDDIPKDKDDHLEPSESDEVVEALNALTRKTKEYKEAGYNNPLFLALWQDIDE